VRTPPPPGLSAPATLAIAAAGGFALHLLHVPLAWMIGAMLATAAAGWTRRAAVPNWLRPIALLTLGLGLGTTFSGPVLAAVVGALPLLLAAGVLSIAVGWVVAPLFTRLAGLDPRTGFYCAVPGGVVVMAVLAQRAGAAVAPVTLAQTLRLVVVVLLFPPLLGWFAPHGDAGSFAAIRPAVSLPGLALLFAAGIGVAWPLARSGFANPWMLGPCAAAIVLAASDHLPSALPVPLIDAAQLGMGASLGVRLSRGFLLAASRLAVASLASAAALSVLLALLAWGLAALSGLPVAAVILGMAPGGMPEMALTAKALEMAVPLVLGFHLVRTLLANVLVGPLGGLGARLGLLGGALSR